MKITCLLENTSISEDLVPRHGLSLFIETGDTALLFDLGPDDAAMKNAAKMGIDVSRAAMALISHGHNDHGGGLAAFMEACPDTGIIMTKEAAGRFYVRAPGKADREISIDPRLTEGTRFISGDTRLSPGLSLFTGFEKTGFLPMCNATLYKGACGGIVPDDFTHELALLAIEGEKTVLFTGCSHSGITNMIKTVLKRTGLPGIDVVVGGFHLSSSSMGGGESPERLDILAGELNEFKETLFYTGHCTGATPFTHLKNHLGDRLLALSTGIQIQI